MEMYGWNLFVGKLPEVKLQVFFSFYCLIQIDGVKYNITPKSLKNLSDFYISI